MIWEPLHWQVQGNEGAGCLRIRGSVVGIKIWSNWNFLYQGLLERGSSEASWVVSIFYQYDVRSTSKGRTRKFFLSSSIEDENPVI
jgi:hypothetical protein